jgi:hypothetical protein
MDSTTPHPLHLPDLMMSANAVRDKAKVVVHNNAPTPHLVALVAAVAVSVVVGTVVEAIAALVEAAAAMAAVVQVLAGVVAAVKTDAPPAAHHAVVEFRT